MKKLPNHEEYSKFIRTQTLAELKAIYVEVCSKYGPDSGIAALVGKHISRKIQVGRV